MGKMDKLKTMLMERAKRRYKRIFPCAKSRKFIDCFTRHNNTLYFWFDTKDRNTHIVSEKI